MGARDYLQVKEAAALLQVSPNTVRAWGETGKIPEYRHPLNGYRLYRKTDLEQVVRQLEQMVPTRVKKRRIRPR